ncbi:MAG TPA: zf-HC2 domain-containing protein [Vicinamibacterales bacterium]|jgi:predicted anti-sigma-YlaC factor YlaD
MLSCREVTSLATEYAERGLPWTTRLQVRLHLAMCWMCRRYYQQLALTSRVLHQLSGGDAPVQTPESLHQVFRQWKAERPNRPSDHQQ